MPTRAFVASTSERAAPEAVDRIASDLRADGGSDLAPDLLLAFATEAYDQTALVAAFEAAFPDTPIVGSSGEGVIVGDDAFETDYYAAAIALRSETIRFEPFLLEEFAADSSGAGRRLVSLIEAAGDVFGVLVFPDGLTGNCSDFLGVLDESLGPEPVVLGGTSGDGMRMERTWQYCGGRAVSGAVSGVLFRGRGRVTWAVSHGCTPIGLHRVVTEADGGWVKKIDGQPAWDVFREYLAGDVDTLNFEGIIHLCVGLPLDGEAAEEYGDYRIVTPMRLDPESGALYFPGGGIEAGARIQLTRRDEDAIRVSATDCARRVAAECAHGDPAFVLQFDCAGRGRALFGSRTSDAVVRPLRAEFAQGVPWLGFHTYGEIAPVAGERCYHNYTVVLCGIVDE